MTEASIAGIIFKYGTNDYSLWIPDLSAKDNQKLKDLLAEFANEGSSVRGTKKDILKDMEDNMN